ncbi:MAG TPA: hypothetical protein VGG55_00080 [Candidatus Acidoferrales bacterium]|jgi:hypothetical protein
MAWLHDNGDDNELSRMEEDDGEKEGMIEETEEEVIVTERPGAPSLPPPLRAGRPKPRKAAKAEPAKARPKKKAAAKKKAPAAKRKKAASSSKRRKAGKRGKRR